MLKALACVVVLACLFIINKQLDVPEVWIGDRTHSCIVIVMPDGSEMPCPEDKSQLPDTYIPIYVMEEVEP